jgi:hypothetical protein
MTSPRIVPITKTAARQFVELHHRHNEAPTPAQVSFAAALAEGDEVVAVVTAGRPVARMLGDGYTLEVSRVCVRDGFEPTKNANSRLYGAVRRVAVALGYRRLVTYTLHSESGASLRASGFTRCVDIGARSWHEDNHGDRIRHDVNLWGERTNAANEPKYRWEMDLVNESDRVAA